MNAISTTEAHDNFPDIISRAEYQGERILIHRNGKPIVAIIGLDDLRLLEAVEDAIDSEIMRRAIEKNDGFTTLEEIVTKRENE